MGVDWLSLTMGDDLARELVELSEVIDEGKGKNGFKNAQRREMIGGPCWRRWEPISASKRWGLAYESWEWESGAARWPAEHLAGKDCKPSRIDIAFDFSVEPDVLSDHFIDRCAEHSQRMGFQIGISGASDVNTRYIGSVHSERRIRIYRKDLREAAWALLFGPTLRIELVLRDDRAEDFWAAWSLSRTGALRQAAGHVLQMTGVCVMAESDDPVELARVDPVFDVAERASWLFKQYGPVLDALFMSGVDVVALAAERMGRSASRTATWRRSHLCRAIDSAGVEPVEDAIRLLLGLEH